MLAILAGRFGKMELGTRGSLWKIVETAKGRIGTVTASGMKEIGRTISSMGKGNITTTMETGIMDSMRTMNLMDSEPFITQMEAWISEYGRKERSKVNSFL